MNLEILGGATREYILHDREMTNSQIAERLGINQGKGDYRGSPACCFFKKKRKGGNTRPPPDSSRNSIRLPHFLQ